MGSELRGDRGWGPCRAQCPDGWLLGVCGGPDVGVGHTKVTVGPPS